MSTYKLPDFKIAFKGPMGAGKTALANALVKKHGGVRLAFGDKLKEEVIELNLTPDGKIDKLRDRKVLQNFGQFRRGEIPKLEINGKTLQNENGLFYLITNSYDQDEQSNSCLYEYLGECEPHYW